METTVKLEDGFVVEVVSAELDGNWWRVQTKCDNGMLVGFGAGMDPDFTRACKISANACRQEVTRKMKERRKLAEK